MSFRAFGPLGPFGITFGEGDGSRMNGGPGGAPAGFRTKVLPLPSSVVGGGGGVATSSRIGCTAEREGLPAGSAASPSSGVAAALRRRRGCGGCGVAAAARSEELSQWTPVGDVLDGGGAGIVCEKHV